MTEMFVLKKKITHFRQVSSDSVAHLPVHTQHMISILSSNQNFSPCSLCNAQICLHI